MTFPTDQVEELKQLCAGVKQCEEAGCIYLLLPGLQLPDGCAPANTDALLCPTERDGYALFSSYWLVARASLAQAMV